MVKILMIALDWSEVWALVIPLLILLFHRKQPEFLKPVIVYLFLALLLNVIVDTIMVFKSHFPSWLQSNNPFYNIHSIIRFICFSLFFIQLPMGAFSKLRKVLAVLLMVFLGINFCFFENFFNLDHLSGNLFSAEAYVLLVYCML